MVIHTVTTWNVYRGIFCFSNLPKKTRAARGPRAKEKLEEMFNDQFKDIRHFTQRAQRISLVTQMMGNMLVHRGEGAVVLSCYLNAP